jgi:hypothetical protein
MEIKDQELYNRLLYKQDGVVRKILYSPGYGAGWLSWNENKLSEEQATFLLEYGPFIKYLEKNKTQKKSEYNIPKNLLKKFEENWRKIFGIEDDTSYYLCTLGARDLEVAEVCVDDQVRITEYDGWERIEVRGSQEWY